LASRLTQTCLAGPKAVCHHMNAIEDLSPEEVATAPPPPWDQAWTNFVKAQRHLLNLVVLESQAEAEISPMHVVQRDETIASIARVRCLLARHCSCQGEPDAALSSLASAS
jgi:hypothetical protein